MLKLPHNWRILAYAICGVKAVSIFVIPLIHTDFMNWIISTSQVVSFISTGHFPPISTFGVYLGTEIILTPFFWLWTILPIEHPHLHNLINYTTPAISLVVLMKLPILISDIFTAIILTRLIKRITNSEKRCAIACLSWLANPYNFYYLYVFGSMDVIPATILLIAVTLAWSQKLTRSGFTTAIGGLIRIYPLAALPFFLHLNKSMRERLLLITGSLFPLACILVLLNAAAKGGTSSILSIPLTQYWLLEFLGGNISGGQLIILTPFLLSTQLYVVFRFWRAEPNALHLATVPILALLLAATTYAGSSNHFIWISALLSACVAIHPEEAWLFASTFIAAYLSPARYPFDLQIVNQSRQILDNLLAGAFWAMKAIYLVRLNLWNTKAPLEPFRIVTTATSPKS